MTKRTHADLVGLLFVLVLGTVLALPGVTPGAAAEESTSIPLAESGQTLDDGTQSGQSESDVWKHGIGSGFRRGARRAGFALGGGSGTRHYGALERHDLALARAGVGRMLGSNWELVGELFGGVQLEPTSRSLVGVTPLLRYLFPTRTPWMPFVDGGVGFTYTNIRDGDISTDFEFNVQVGAGMHVFLREDLALTAQYRWLHLSNAAIKLPNRGTETHVFTVGLNWFY